MTENLKIIQTIELNEDLKKQVFDLWNSEYPDKLTYQNLNEFDNYLQNLNNLKHFLLINNIDFILGWALTFDRDNEKWFAIILSEKLQGKGLGRKMLDEIKNNEKKKNGQPYISPLTFYQKCDFEILSDDRLELDKISAVKINWTREKR